MKQTVISLKRLKELTNHQQEQQEEKVRRNKLPILRIKEKIIISDSTNIERAIKGYFE